MSFISIWSFCDACQLQITLPVTSGSVLVSIRFFILSLMNGYVRETMSNWNIWNWISRKCQYGRRKNWAREIGVVFSILWKYKYIWECGIAHNSYVKWTILTSLSCHSRFQLNTFYSRRQMWFYIIRKDKFIKTKISTMFNMFEIFQTIQLYK